MKIHYSASSYQSHNRVAQTYMQLIQSRYQTTDVIEDADIVVLHHEPSCYEEIYQQYPALSKKYVIGYCVWETTDLPGIFKRAIRSVQEIWTCSQYCYDAFRKYHSQVVYIPHTIERDRFCSDADRAFVRERISYEAGCVYYLTITRLSVRRKNVASLVEAFKAQSAAMPKARLIIKAEGGGRQRRQGPIIFLPADLTDCQINALYELADFYISTHHAEGWGLTLSDAMIFCKPVLATGYSGNLEFMNENNSFLLDFKEEYIRNEDRRGNLTGAMKWAYPDHEDIKKKLLLSYAGIGSGWLAEKVRQASACVELFSPARVKALIEARLDHIIHSLSDGKGIYMASKSDNAQPSGRGSKSF